MDPRRLSFVALLLIVSLLSPAMRAQTCFDYVDGCTHPGWTVPMPLPNCVNAIVPIRCVQQGPLAASGSLVNCSWDGDCHEDGNPSDCCTAVVTSEQANLQMHTAWHNCFGNIGDPDGNNPPGRGQRWYAFHRQFEFDFSRWRETYGWGAIQHLDWCPNMLMPIGHPGGGLPSSGAGAHPSLCGTGPSRPANTPCPQCVAFPQCLFLSGGGPIACPTSPSPTCGATGLGPGAVTINFPYTSLDQFKNVEEVSTILDHFFHGVMHGAVGIADRAGPNCNPPAVTTNCYVLDVTNPTCSPRDPMFWRLHKALDDVVRAWQNLKAVDVMLVIDRSGSMNELDSGGLTKLEAALDAVDNFADLLDRNRSDGQQNRIGVVSFSSGATLQMPLTVADPNLRNAGGALDNAINAIRTAGANGCTGIGGGVQLALEQLCPPSGDCRGFSAPGDNDRKAVLLLTDGMENRPPCLKPAGATPSPACGNECFGAGFDIPRMEFTQMVGVGFGNAGTLNGDLLTLLAERQGGIYVQNPNGPGDDLKDFFAKGFGTLTADFVALDPKGLLRAEEGASDPVFYNSCIDSMITFDSGWKKNVTPGELRLLVNTPSGTLVRGGAPAVQDSTERVWAYSRVRLPFRSQSTGSWRAQLVRPHQTYVNGFTPDAFARLDDGVMVVRRQIQRLCPTGCRRVLYFDYGLRGQSAYAAALKIEADEGLISRPKVVTTPSALNAQLRDAQWDLIVYAYMRDDRALPFDQTLTALLCRGQRAIVSDTRLRSAASLLRCGGAEGNGTTNWTALEGDGRLFDGTIKLSNPGHPVFTYGLRLGPGVQATSSSRDSGAIIAKTSRGLEQNWFVDVLTTGLSRLSPVREKLSWKTGEDLVAIVRILPSDIRAGGYDKVDARVEIEYPKIGLGTVLSRQRGRSDRTKGEALDPRAAVLNDFVIPTETATFPLYDDGTHGDLHPDNAYWTATLPGLSRFDGMYKFHYIVDLTVNNCTTRRELTQSIFVDVGVKNDSSKVSVVATNVLPDGTLRADVRLVPADRYGNLLGPGRSTSVATCAPADRCRVENVKDQGDGTYTASIVTAPGRTGVRVQGLTGSFDIALPCDSCPRLLKLALPSAAIPEHATTEATVFLSGPALKSGAGTLIYLESSQPQVVNVPDTVIVPPGQDRAVFPVQVRHAHEGPVHVTLTASEGRGESRSRSFTVTPLPPREATPPLPNQEYIHAGHMTSH